MMVDKRKYDWTATKPVKKGDYIYYELSRLKTTIRCSTRDDMKTVKKNIKKSLERLNNKVKGGYA